MDEEIETLLVSVRADTAAFARDVGEMKSALEGPFKAGVERAGQALETALVRAIRTGKLGFEDLRRIALSVLQDIAASAIRSGIGAILSGLGGGGKGGGVGALLGLVGRSTGGPVAPGRGYLVGERGPELFVPTASGRVEPSAPGGGRDVRLSITINAPNGTEPRALAQSSRQVARAVKRALMQIED
jgi:phage-related minor tail protein